MLSTLALVIACCLLTAGCTYAVAFRRGLKLGVALTLRQIDSELTLLESLKLRASAQLRGGPYVH